MIEVSDLCCERCGGQEWTHRLARDAHGVRRWQNRCGGCGHVSEYLPTRDEIRYECEKIRCEQGLVEVDDEQEKFWRQRVEEMSLSSDSDAPDEW